MRGVSWFRRRRPRHRAPQPTFGLPPATPHLIAKLRVMDPALRASILTTKETTK